MNPNLKALLERLLTHNVDFVLVGGFAALPKLFAKTIGHMELSA